MDNKLENNSSKLSSYQLLTLPVSSHKLKYGEKMYSYNGNTIGLWFKGIYFYWGRDITQKAAFANKLRHALRMIVNIFLILILLLSFLFWAKGLLLFKLDVLVTKLYWLTPSSNLVFFWFGILGLCFLYYRYYSNLNDNVNILEKKFEHTDSKKYYEPVNSNIGNKNRIELSRVFNEHALASLYEAQKLAKKLGNASVEPIHLLSVLPNYNNIAVMFGRLGILGDKFQKTLVKALSYFKKENINEPVLSFSLHRIILRSYLFAYEAGLEKVDVADLLISLVLDEEDDQENLINSVFEELEVTDDKIHNVVEWMHIRQRVTERYKRFRRLARFKPKGDVNRAMTSIQTKGLDTFSQDLTRLAAYEKLMPLIGRKKEIQEIFRTIEGTSKSVLLVGNSGVGRMAIMEGIAQLMVTEDVPEMLQDKRFSLLDISSLIGGVDPVTAQERMLTIMNESIVSGNIIIGINSIEKLIGISTGGQSSMDLSQLFAETLHSGRIFAIATTDPQSYTKFIEGTSLSDAFTIVKIDELSVNEAIQVVEMNIARIEYQQAVYFSYDAIEKAVILSDRYIQDKYLPEKAIGIVEEVAIYVRNNKKGTKIVTAEDVAYIISNKTNIPFTAITKSESDKLLNLESLMHERIIGQDEAVKVVAASLRRARTDLRDKDKPIANLLFLGSTGVGKTEVAKTLAELYFGDEENMIRFDMSEYQEKSSIERLLGNLNSPGHLTEAVRKNPFSLILFDELEKAHPDILNIFLQMMDDGRLTDGLGRKIDFTNTIIIATSNAGTSFIQEQISEGIEMDIITDSLIKVELKQYYRPEFLNRFDNIVVFKPLLYSEIIQIAGLLIKKVAKRLEKKGIHFEVTEAAIIELAKKGYDPLFGARPLKRVIQDHVDNALANHLLAGKIGKRDQVILDQGGKITINKASRL